MDLLGEENNVNKQDKSSKKKVILVLLIISIILLILALIMMSALKGAQPKKETLLVNGLNVNIPDNLFTTIENEGKYISLRGLANLVKYKYCNGSLFEITEDKDKCYLQNQNSIVGFEANSKKIYKTEENSLIECQYYELQNKIISYNDNLYISTKDIQQACNLVYSYSAEKNQTIINTTNFLIENLQKGYDDKEANIKIDVTDNNQKAVSYNMLVISTNNKCGVLNRLNTSETIISTKYDSLDFNEYTENFIASNNNKYGVISKQGKGIIDLKYDSIRVIGYDPLLYEIKQNNKYGVLDKNGEIVVKLEFDGLGFENDTTNTTFNSLLIIKDIKEDIDGIVVCTNKKYGVVNLLTGEIILECKLDKIYSKTSDLDKPVNYVEFNDKEYTLDEYIKYVNTITVVNNRQKQEQE